MAFISSLKYLRLLTSQTSFVIFILISTKVYKMRKETGNLYNHPYQKAFYIIKPSQKARERTVLRIPKLEITRPLKKMVSDSGITQRKFLRYLRQTTQSCN
jgi:hypothetical protein